MNNYDNKINFIKKYKKIFSFIPLKAVKGSMKVPAISGWEKYCITKSDFFPEELALNNFGITTGIASNLLVLDIDDPDVFESFIRRNNYSVNESFSVQSGKGRHVYTMYPNDGCEYGNKKFGALGFDIRGNGGQVVGPFSYHEEFECYYDIISENDIPDSPGWLKNYCLNILGSAKPNIDKIKNPEILKLIESGAELGLRSEAIRSVLMSLVYYKFNDDQIYYVFNKYKIGTKYREKPESIREGWLQSEIDRVREKVTTSPDIIESHFEIPNISYLNGSDLLQKDCRVEWLVDGLIEKGGHTLITGKSGVGKSSFSLNLALTLATAPKEGFLGHSIPKPLQVAIIQCENQESFMQDRLRKLCDTNPEYARGQDSIYFPYFDDRHDSPKFKFSNDNLDKLIRRIHEDVKPDLIIVDPYKSYSGVPENDNDRNRDVLDRLFYHLNEFGITSIIIHHEGKLTEHSGTAKSRGASTITDAVHNHWSISRNKIKSTNENSLAIDCFKARNYEKFSQINLVVQNGVFFKYSGNGFDPKKLVDILLSFGGEIETKGRFIGLIKNEFGVSDKNAKNILSDAVVNGYVIETKYGQNKIKYTSDLYRKAA